MKHTDGPWRTNGLRIEYGPTGHGWQIAQVNRDVHDHEGLANARLIAAAPELLAALVGLIELIERTPDRSPRFAIAWSAIEPLVTEARAAINKAEGRN